MSVNGSGPRLARGEAGAWSGWSLGSRLLVLLALVSAAALAPRGGATELGLGGGVAWVSESDLHLAALRPHLNGRVSWRAGRLRLGLELSAFGLFDEQPSPSDFSGAEFERIPEVLGVFAAMLTAQFGDAGLYLRPSLGLARHAFPIYHVPGPGNDARGAEISHEIGPAVGLALGRQVARLGATRLTLEGVLLVSAGEDSSSTRRVVGLQLVALWGR